MSLKDSDGSALEPKDHAQASQDSGKLEVVEEKDPETGLTRRAIVKRGGVVIGAFVIASYVAPHLASHAAGPVYAAGSPTPTPTNTPVPPCPRPTCAQIAANATIIACIDAAWTASNPYTYATRREVGFWIIQDCTNPAAPTLRCSGQITGTRDGIDPGAPPAVGANERVVGFFHTHPNPETDERNNRWTLGPSPADVRVAAELNRARPGWCELLVHHTAIPPVNPAPPPARLFTPPLPPRSGVETF